MLGEEFGWYLISGLILIPIAFLLLGIVFAVRAYRRKSYSSLVTALIFLILCVVTLSKGIDL